MLTLFCVSVRIWGLGMRLYYTLCMLGEFGCDLYVSLLLVCSTACVHSPFTCKLTSLSLAFGPLRLINSERAIS